MSQNKMTPEQKIKWAILVEAKVTEEEITEENIDEFYEEYEYVDGVQDTKYEFRSGQVETNIPCEYSRHYESYSVASKMPDGSWVGWTYWYGGGKHAEPEAIDWMEYAYELDCQEEEKLIVVQTFTKKETT